jgi:hypothetical protein
MWLSKSLLDARLATGRPDERVIAGNQKSCVEDASHVLNYPRGLDSCNEFWNYFFTFQRFR